jgi:molecular chaperone GrpE
MARTNGKSEVGPEKIDATHELPVPEDAGGDPATIESPRESTEISELQKLRVERDTLVDRLARLQAEFENVRKRIAREQHDFREYAVGDAIKTLLPILDSFERALETGSAERAEFREGVELIYKQMQDALLKLGVRPIPAKGEPFDPHLHEAVEMVETSDAADHQILEELQRGYKVKDRLLRPSMVKVASNPKR